MTLALLTPMAMAAPWLSDQWFIDKAIAGMHTLHPETIGIPVQGTLISWWEHHGVGWHRHIEVTGTFGYQNTGSIYWTGRVYAYWEYGHASGDVHEIEYSFTKPEPKPLPPAVLRCKYVMVAPCQFYWDGGSWKFEPRFVTGLRDAIPDNHTGMYDLTFTITTYGDAKVYEKVIAMHKGTQSICIVMPHEMFIKGMEYVVTWQTQYGIFAVDGYVH